MIISSPPDGRSMPDGRNLASEEQSLCGRFGQSRRVRKRRDFQRIQQSPGRVKTRHCVILVAPSDQTEARLGITASRRVGNAVVRNRAKRMIRVAFRATQQRLWASPVDIVVVVRSIEADMKSGQIIEEWLQAESRIRRLIERTVASSSKSVSISEPTQS